MEGNKTPVIIIPAEYCECVMHRINVIREKDDGSIDLAYECKNLNKELINEYGVAGSKADLKVGGKYGVVGYSSTATAHRRGKQLKYHGEIYLYLWTYGEDGKFHQADALGGIHDSWLPGCPLVECW